MANMLFTNNAATTLASSLSNSATTLSVASGTGAAFPSLSGSQYFYCTLQTASGSTVEIVKVTGRSTDTFTIVRAQDNTGASAFSSGDKVELRLVAANLNDLPKLDEVNTFTTNVYVGATSTSTGSIFYSQANSGNSTAAAITSDCQTSGGVSHANYIATGNTYYTVFATGTVATHTVSGSITYTGSGTAYNTTSDRRLKTNIVPLTNAGTTIDLLQPRSFVWSSTQTADVGFIADELQQVLPNSVTGKPNAVDSQGNPVYQMIDASTPEVVALLVSEVQSLRARLKAANIA
jgi:hypothetical protein